MQSLEKVWQEAGIKLSSVAPRMLGASGLAMLNALVSDTTDPDALADLVKERLWEKIPALKKALEGHVCKHHAVMAGTILSHVDYLDEVIARFSSEIEGVIAAPFYEQVELPTLSPTSIVAGQPMF